VSSIDTRGESMEFPLLKPALYAHGASEPVLLGGACVCGHVFFPMQSFGCERCGRHGEALSGKALRGVGVLLAATVVHLHHDKQRPPPFAIGAIQLDDGPVVRARLSDLSLVDACGSRVQAEFVSVANDAGAATLDLLFKRAVA
jgi:uncharacterized OB-fold protein